MAAGQRVLVRHERVRRRLVAGGLRRRPELRGAGCAAREPPGRARRVPSPPGPARRGGRHRLRHGERVLRQRGQRARERRLAVGLRLRMDARRPDADAAVRLVGGLRTPQPRRPCRSGDRPLRLRLGAEERERARTRGLHTPDRRGAGQARGRDQGLRERHA